MKQINRTPIDISKKPEETSLTGRALNAEVEKLALDYCIAYWREHNEDIEIVKQPIPPEAQSRLSKGQSVPDGVICLRGEKRWIEITTFSRNEVMHGKLMAKNGMPEKSSPQADAKWIENHKDFPKQCVDGGILGEGVPLPRTACKLDIRPSFLKALEKKVKKDYTEFAEGDGIKKEGILIILFVNTDPFFNANECYSFINETREYLNSGMANQFDEIIFIAYCVTIEQSCSDASETLGYERWVVQLFRANSPTADAK